jgi:ferredoxin
MIVAEQKSFEQILENLAGFRSVLVLGCGTCVTVCMSGGEKEVGILAEQIRLHQRDTPEDQRLKIVEATIERQCDVEFFDPVRDLIAEADCVLSMGCGVGVQHLAEYFEDKIVIPALNTKFFGATQEPGVWVERCAGCGDCILDTTAGVCPIARCSKSLLNGPCGGSQGGKCEIDPEVECAWQLVIDRLNKTGGIDNLKKIVGVRDWSKDRHGGPRTVTREEARE